ncbi:RNA-directed DNA polymerase from mobile element jockey-like protein [Labeo rohita]|uniref:RNA-directed DNA polymerase from mobile element jockey-like protein n=1 Tax=Labeo rohita TaxID=84645 RepID=A0A498LX08_LABRO|nr:RNA-directed DNA polymerase from mobile element jockey-like protein [Labeo rohita]
MRSRGGGGSILSHLRLASPWWISCSPQRRIASPGLPVPAGVAWIEEISVCFLVSRSSSADLLLRFALINVRSVANKTFILNDFFASRELDFMFMTETWLNVGTMSDVASQFIFIKCLFVYFMCLFDARVFYIDKINHIGAPAAGVSRVIFDYVICVL